MKKLWQYVKPFSSDSGTSRTDGRTDRQTDRIAILISRINVLTRDKKSCLNSRYERRSVGHFPGHFSFGHIPSGHFPRPDNFHLHVGHSLRLLMRKRVDWRTVVVKGGYVLHHLKRERNCPKGECVGEYVRGICQGKCSDPERQTGDVLVFSWDRSFFTVDAKKRNLH